MCLYFHVLPAKHRQMALLLMHFSLTQCVHVFFFGLCVQAAFILQNLLVMPMPANAEEAKDSHWQVSSFASQLKRFYSPRTVFSLPLFLAFFVFVPLSVPPSHP